MMSIRRIKARKNKLEGLIEKFYESCGEITGHELEFMAITGVRGESHNTYEKVFVDCNFTCAFCGLEVSVTISKISHNHIHDTQQNAQELVRELQDAEKESYRQPFHPFHIALGVYTSKASSLTFLTSNAR